MQVRDAGQHRIVVQAELQRPLVEPPGLGETTACLPELRPIEGSADGEGDVAGVLQTGHTLDVDPLGLLQIATRPVRKGQEEGGAAVPDVIIFRQEAQWARRHRVPRRIDHDQFAGRVERPTRSALTCHRRPATRVSYEDVLDFLGLLLAKYWPVTPSTCADEAR